MLLWILDRCDGKADAVETPIGYLPRPEDIDIEGLDLTTDTIRDLLTVDRESWLSDVTNIREFYAQIGDHMPKELYEELDKLEANLKK